MVVNLTGSEAAAWSGLEFLSVPVQGHGRRSGIARGWRRRILDGGRSLDGPWMFSDIYLSSR